MNPYLQTTLFGFVISLILTALLASADTAKATPSQINYSCYSRFYDLEAYHGFFPFPRPRRTPLLCPDESHCKY